MKTFAIKFLPVAIIVCVALFLSGCIFNRQPYRDVNYYDLSCPEERAVDGVVLKINSFKVTEAMKYRMAYREDNCRILLDDYNKWIQPPGFMLARYLQAAFSGNAKSSHNDIELGISGTLFTFSIDLKSMQAALGVSYKITHIMQGIDATLMRNSVVFKSKIKSQSPTDFAKAMSVCAAQLASRLQGELVSLREDIRRERIEKKK